MHLLVERLQTRKKQNAQRSLSLKKTSIDFASNDYLGLARSPLMRQKVQAKWEALYKTYPQSIGLGSTGSRLLTGNHEYAEEIETQIAEFHGYKAGLLFATGYMANIGLISSVAQRGDSILYDTHIHASTHDGIRLSVAKAYPFKHNDFNHLEKQLQRRQASRCCFVCIESVYSQDGSIAPLTEIARVCRRYHAELIVDEAHAVGIFGSQGRGLIAACNLQESVFAQIVTFGKALGCQGAIVLGSHVLKEYLINFSKTCLYSTALPLYSLAAIQAAYELFPEFDAARAFLQKLCKKLQKSATPIQPVRIRNRDALLLAAEYVAQNDMDVRAIRWPTVRPREEHLRICLHAFNTEAEVDLLLSCLKQIEVGDV